MTTFILKNIIQNYFNQNIDMFYVKFNREIKSLLFAECKDNGVTSAEINRKNIIL